MRFPNMCEGNVRLCDLILAGSFKRDDNPSVNCKLLDPVKGFEVRGKTECSAKCLQLPSLCDGFIYSKQVGWCKFVGSSGTMSHNCHGEQYIVI